MRTQQLILFAILLAPAAAHAWDSEDLWYMPANGGNGAPGAMGSYPPGGGGLIGVGGVRDYNITCADCHIKAEGKIGITFTPNPAWLAVNGVPAYKPGQVYQLAVKLTGEHLGMSGCSQYVPGNVNGFAATFEDNLGKTVGVIASDSGQTSANCPKTDPKPLAGTTITYGDCHAIFTRGNNADVNRTTWSFTWTAPAAATGPVTLFYGVVDGDCMMDSFNVDMYESSAGKLGLDDVKTGNLRLLEGPIALAPTPSRPFAYALLALLPAIGALVRRRRA